jgi:uncharacterized surface protein with fasciclin (FAS1) repeats
MLTQIRRRSAMVGTVLALSLALAACGDGDGDVIEEQDGTADEMTDDEMADDEMAEGEGESALTLQPVGDACSQVPTDGEGSSAGMADDPVATAASNNPLLTTLVTAVGEAGLVDTLNSAENLTVFAPINPAFEGFSEEDLNALLADTETLTTVLTTHVVGQNLELSGLESEGTVTTLAENELELDFSGEGELPTVTSPDGTTAQVVCGNVQTANATVHLIDTVLMPGSGDSGDEMSEDEMSDDEMSEDSDSDSDS